MTSCAPSPGTLAADYELRQDGKALSMVAELPPIPAADRALELVRSGATTGLSVEFRAMKERREGALRVIEAATLTGIGIVRAPSYEQSQVEARRRSGRTMRATIPADAEVECRCSAACNANSRGSLRPGDGRKPSIKRFGNSSGK